MSDSLGFLAKAAYVQARGLYGAGPAIAYPETFTDGDLGAGHQIPFSDEGVQLTYDRVTDPTLDGSGGMLPSYIVGKNVAGTLSSALRYRGLERLLAHSFGFEHPDDSPANLAVGAEAHLFELDYSSQLRAWVTGDDRDAGAWSANDRVVRHGHLGLIKETNDYIWTNVMVNKLTISGNPTEVKVAFDLIGYDLLRGDYSSDTWTLPTGSTNMALFQQSEIKFGTRATAVTDPLTLPVIEPSSFEFSVELALKGDDRTPGSAPNILQPVRASRYEPMLKLEFPRHSSETNEGYFETDTPMSCSIIITGPQIAATGQYYKYSLFLPYLSATDRGGPATSGESPLTKTYNLIAARDTADPFETTYYQSIRITKDSAVVLMVQNEDTGNYLTEV
jgi:hypothetical protein